MRNWFLLAATCSLSACASSPRSISSPPFEVARLPFHVDTARSERVAPGVTHEFLYTSEGPWAIHLLDVQPNSCIDFRAVKAHRTAAGREPTTLLLEGLDESVRIVGGVNSDYFSLATGVPQTAHVENGRVITGPSPRSVFAFDSAGKPFIGELRTPGTVRAAGVSHPLIGWNRIRENGLSVIDRAWGAATDSGSGRIEVALDGSRVLSIDTLPAGLSIPPSGAVLVAGRNASPALRNAVAALRIGDSVTFTHAFQPMAPKEATGGWQVMLRDGVVTSEADSGATNGPVRHPRTAAAIFPDGRVMFLVVDGRQKPYSDGMTLREVARVFQSLGARDAINLDGGGSSTFVLRGTDGVMRIQNRPSDKVERPVSNVMAVVNRC